MSARTPRGRDHRASMNEDQVHQARCDKERFFLVMETTAERSRHLWSVREKLREHCMAHWAVIGFSRPATLEQIYRPSVSGADFKEIFEQSLQCSLLMLYTDTCIVSFGDHSRCSGHFGCKLLSWVSSEEWVDTIGLDVPEASATLMAWLVCLLRVWRLQILRSYWASAAAPAPSRNLGQSFFQGSYDAPVGTHPQARARARARASVRVRVRVRVVVGVRVRVRVRVRARARVRVKS